MCVESYNVKLCDYSPGKKIRDIFFSTLKQVVWEEIVTVYRYIPKKTAFLLRISGSLTPFDFPRKSRRPEAENNLSPEESLSTRLFLSFCIFVIRGVNGLGLGIILLPFFVDFFCLFFFCIGLMLYSFFATRKKRRWNQPWKITAKLLKTFNISASYQLFVYRNGESVFPLSRNLRYQIDTGSSSLLILTKRFPP